MDKMSFSHHISHQYNEELAEILDNVRRMGELVEQQLTDALAALAQGKPGGGEQAVTNDYKVNACEVRLDEGCIHVLARRQPAASDLRLIIAVVKTITDLERVGDEAERIGRMALDLQEADRRCAPMEEVAALGQLVMNILHGALDAFARMDAEQAVKVAQEDIKADTQYESIVRHLMQCMQESPKLVASIMDILWSVRSLERIGDRACNICEYVIYFVRGKDVRHTSFEQMVTEARSDRR